MTATQPEDLTAFLADVRMQAEDHHLVPGADALRLVAAVEAVLAITETPRPGEVQYDLDGPLGFEVSCAAVREAISRALLGEGETDG